MNGEDAPLSPIPKPKLGPKKAEDGEAIICKPIFYHFHFLQPNALFCVLLTIHATLPKQHIYLLMSLTPSLHL